MLYIYICFLLWWERELAAAQLNLAELVILECIQKLFVLETKFNSKFNCYTVQEDWLLKTRNQLRLKTAFKKA